MQIEVSDHAALRERIVLRKWEGPKRGKRESELRQGDDYFHREGRWVEVRRLIDRKNDEYNEVVVDPVTGEVIHETHGRLSDHQGHGSAKERGG